MTGPSEKAEKRKRPAFPTAKTRIRILLAALAVTAVVSAILFFWPVPPLWTPASVPYDPECADGCEVFAEARAGHNVPPDAAGPLSGPLLYNPAVDDKIAQWGDCLQSAFNCIRRQPTDDPVAVRQCIITAACPAECGAEFAEESADAADLAALRDVFFDIYVEDGGYCVPESGA